mmetsp:Transcript_21183/g.27286  ORF Transcript_21183/g.27286 Transcript_21183/m.27286 type:complete len:83 (+) Transcript_21183:496-744(+)
MGSLHFVQYDVHMKSAYVIAVGVMLAWCNRQKEVESWCIDTDERRTALSSSRSPTMKNTRIGGKEEFRQIPLLIHNKKADRR